MQKKLRKIKVLVTGAGSGVGQSIIRALKKSDLNLEVIAADINRFNAGLYFTKKYLIIPKVEEINSKETLLKIFKKNKINILFIGSELELLFFSKNKFFFETQSNINICVSPVNTIKISNDKYLTYKFLKEKNISHPRTFLVKNFLDAKKISKILNFPFILKNRIGTSSREVFLIKNTNDLKNNLKLLKDPIIQEALIFKKNKGVPLIKEYTCSFFTTYDKKVLGPFIANRTIKNGTSWIVKTDKFFSNRLKDLIFKIAKSIDNVGSFNIQLAKTSKGEIPFEFNSRFSGTSSVRANFGFNEPEFFIKSYFLKQNINPNKIKIKQGVCLRYVDEIFLKN
jgi:carbamoyl-phosphate synthase large subunit